MLGRIFLGLSVMLLLCGGVAVSEAEATGRSVFRSRSVSTLGVPQRSFSERVVVRQRGVVVQQPAVVQLRGVQTLGGAHCVQQGFFTPRVHDPGLLLFFGP